MSWVESHQSLKNHPKTTLLAKKLGIPKAQAIGHLHLLWWWCVDYAKEGRLDKYAPEQIAEAAEWPGNAGEFLQHMADAGFIDRNPLRVHDWFGYRLHYDLYQAKKERNLAQVRRRVKRWRDRNATSNAPVTVCNAPKDLKDLKDVTGGKDNVFSPLLSSPPSAPRSAAPDAPATRGAGCENGNGANGHGAGSHVRTERPQTPWEWEHLERSLTKVEKTQSKVREKNYPKVGV